MATLRKESWKYTDSTALTGGELLKWTAKDTVQLATAVTDKIVGVAAEACSAGNVTTQNIGVWPLVTDTTVQMIASAAIAAGAYVAVTAAGQIVTGATKSATGNTTVSYQLGWANEAAATANDVIDVVCLLTEINV